MPILYSLQLIFSAVIPFFRLSLHLSSLAGNRGWGWGFQISEKGTDWLADWPSEVRARDTNRIWKVWSSYPSRDIRHIWFGVISAAPSVLLMSGDVGIGYAWVYLGIPGFGYTCVLLKKPYTHSFQWKNPLYCIIFGEHTGVKYPVMGPNGFLRSPQGDV